jgi:hypothetical protein
MGFTIAFAALLAKLLRINRILGQKNPFCRVVVEAKDVVAPFAILSHFTLQSCWFGLSSIHFNENAAW